MNRTYVNLWGWCWLCGAPLTGEDAGGTLCRDGNHRKQPMADDATIKAQRDWAVKQYDDTHDGGAS